MPVDPPVIRRIAALRAAVVQLRQRGGKVALVPTMGALHARHMSLVRAGRKRARRDASRSLSIRRSSPRTKTSATTRAPEDRSGGAQRSTSTSFGLQAPGNVSDGSRPDRASSAATVGPGMRSATCHRRRHNHGHRCSLKSDPICDVRQEGLPAGWSSPRWRRDLDLGVKVIGVPTMREKDGLALSSRNVYLSAAERQAAPRFIARSRIARCGLD